MPAPYSLVIFDLDGTLADSFPWFLRNLNGIADKFGFRRVAPDEIEPLRGAPSREILRRLEVPMWKVPMIANHMRALKGKHLDEIPLFAGVDAMLRQLAEGGLRLALVSSDQESNVRRQIGELAPLFADFACGASLFGKASKFRGVLKRLVADPARTVAIGDEVRDIEAARAAGVAAGSVTWGFATKVGLAAQQPDFIFERIEDIAPVLLRPTRPASGT